LHRFIATLLPIATMAAALLPGVAQGRPAAASNPCVVTAKSGPNSNCGPYDTSKITLSNGYNTYVANNGWACGPDGSDCGPQKLTAYNPSQWSVRSNQAAGNTAVLTYPDVMQLVQRKDGNARALRTFSSIRSYFAERMPHNSGTDAEAGYDLWLANTRGSNEVMIWVDNVNRGTGGARRLTHHTFVGVRYALLQYGGPGGELIWSRHRNAHKGTVHILAMLRWLVHHRYESTTTALGQVDFGWEICSTGGNAESFKVSGYTLKTKRA
jgi:hypothetical protein